MTPRERLLAALNHTQPDYTPCDYYATPEIHEGLSQHFGLPLPKAPAGSLSSGAAVREDTGITDRLGTDLRHVNPPYTGPAMPTFDDGSSMNLWGICRRPMANEYGEYAEPVGEPYAPWTTIEEAAQWPWPNPDWFDYSAIPALCARHKDLGIITGGMHVQDFINGVSAGRGVEQVLVDIATEDPVYLYIVDQRHRFYLRHIERILDAAQGRIDLVLCGDDFGTQRGLLISPENFDAIFASRKREFFDMVHSYGAKVTHHCCGSSHDLIPRFIDLGMDALQTIQPQAAGMNPYALKQEFAGRITLHGAVDVQGWLQHSTPEEIETEVNNLMDQVGHNGGYILAPSHNLQPDTPLENVLTVYRTIAKRRGQRID